MYDEKDNTQVELENTGEIELPKFDPKPYIGKEVEIANVSEHQGNYGYYIKVETEKVADFNGKDVRASRIFGLQTDADGNIGWGPETKLGIFLKRKGVSHYKDLQGKKVTLISKVNKDGLEFLDFN